MEKTCKALIIGDVVGRCGRQALERTLADLQCCISSGVGKADTVS